MNPADHLAPQTSKPVQHGLTPLGAKVPQKIAGVTPHTRRNASLKTGSSGATLANKLIDDLNFSSSGYPKI
jgi:hypothetical protein